MSEWHVEVVRLGTVEKHPNADKLGITHVHGGYPVICRLGDYAEGDLAVYVPVDSVVPNTEEWAFVGSRRRVRAKRLRGTFSMGLLTKAPEGAVEGEDVAERLGIFKWEEPVEAISTQGKAAKAPLLPGPPLPVYDIEALRRRSSILFADEEVVITEKIHGANFRAVHDGERLHVASRNRFLSREECKLWWPVAERFDLEAKLARFPNMAIYGEVYGNVQDLKYGLGAGATLAVFDILNVNGTWWDFDSAQLIARSLDLPWVPVLYRGPWSKELCNLAEGPSTLPGSDHVREGIVVRPVRERWDDCIGRVQLKMHGEGYLTRKSG